MQLLGGGSPLPAIKGRNIHMKIRVKALDQFDNMFGVKIGQVYDVIQEHGDYYVCTHEGTPWKYALDKSQVEVLG